MYWWNKAALLTEQSAVKSFGLITTNSIVQSYSNSLIQKYLDRKEILINFAVPDHPWVDSQDCADVRVAM